MAEREDAERWYYYLITNSVDLFNRIYTPYENLCTKFAWVAR